MSARAFLLMRRFGFEISVGTYPKVTRLNEAPIEVEHDKQGNWWNWIWSSNSDDYKCRKFKSEKQKLEVALTNPALLRVLKINCDLFSLGKINQYNPDGSEKEADFLYSQLAQPNKFQSWTQFNWDGMFWIQLGTGYLWRSGNVINDSFQMYWLNPTNIEWPSGWKSKLSRFVFSKVGLNEMLDEKIKYNWPDGTYTKIRLKEITPFHDLSNGLGDNWFKGESALDALYKVIMNSERALDAKGRNLDFAGKFLVSGQADPSDNFQTPMSDEEKLSIEQKMRSGKWVHAIKSKVNIDRFVENINNLKLDEQFFNDYFTMGAMMGIPKDVLEVTLKGATFENQEKSIGRHVEYALKPKGQLLTDFYESQFGFIDIRMSWAHCLFNQVFEKDKAERQKLQLENVQLAVNMQGITQDEAAKEVKRILSM